MTTSVSLNQQYHARYKDPSPVLPSVVITAVALVSITAITLGVLAHLQIVIGLNAMTQWTLMGAGAFGLLASTSCGLLYHFWQGQALSPYVSEGALERVKTLFETRALAQADPGQLAIDIASLEPAQLKEILMHFFEDAISEGGDPLKLMSQVSNIVPYKALEEVVKTQFSGNRSALHTARKMCGEAKYYLEARATAQPTLYARWLSFHDTLISVLDSILLAFGIAEFFKPSDGNSFQNEMKFQKIMMLVSFFTLLTATLLPMLGVTTGASVVGGTLLFIALLSIIWPHVKPLVSQVPFAENWTRQVQLKQLWTSGGRKGAVRSIAEALIDKKHPLVIGPSGIGKTQTVVSFVEAIERGDFPELKGKKVFYFNTADLVGNYDWFKGGNDIFKKINDTIGRHRDNCILVFDEIHLAYQKRGETPLGEQLKTFLDEKPENSFPYVIGLTTEEEYYRDIYKDNSAADRRFVKVEITNTDFLDTQAILNKYLLQKAPDIIVEPDALEHLMRQTQHAPQPITARKILSQCITRTKTQQSQNVTRAEHVQSRMESEYAKGAVLGHALLVDDDSHLDLIEQLEKELAELQEKIKEEKQELEQLARSKTRLAQVKSEKFKEVLKVASAQDKRAVNEFLLLKYFVEGALEQEVRSQSSSLGVKTVIDVKMIDEVLAEERHNQEKRAQALLRGKTQLAERSA